MRVCGCVAACAGACVGVCMCECTYLAVAGVCVVGSLSLTYSEARDLICTVFVCVRDCVYVRVCVCVCDM